MIAAGFLLGWLGQLEPPYHLDCVCQALLDAKADVNDATTKPKSEMIHDRIHLIASAYEAGTCVQVVLDWAI